MNDSYLDMDWTGNQGLSDSELMNIASGCGYDIMIGANNGEGIRRAYNTLPWKSDYEINNTDEQEEDIDKDKYVDLGLPSGLLWAKCNLGANSPEESGKYYQWGDTEGYTEDQIGGKEGKSFEWETYKYAIINGKELQLTKYCNDPKIGLNGYTDDLDILEPSDDAVTLELGNKWRIPTPNDFGELLELDSEVTTLNDIPGVKFIGNNRNELFIPFSGCVRNDEIFDKDSCCYLWSNYLDFDRCISSWGLFYFHYEGGKYGYSIDPFDRYIGHPIRPVKISKLKKKFKVIAEPNNNFAGTTNESEDYYEGDTCTLIATPIKDFLFINWTKDGNVVSESPEYSFIVKESATYIANFGVSITTQSDPVEGGTTSGGRTYVIGDTCTLVATPINGYVFQNWKRVRSRPVIVSKDPTYTFEVIATARENSGGTYIAYFGPPQYTITTSSNPVEGGNINGGGTYDKNSTCTLIANAYKNYEFNNWTENGNVVSSESTYSFTVTEDRTIVANFTLQSYDIEATVNDESRGSVSGGGTYTYGDTCTLVATPNSSDYVFMNWTEDGNVVSSESTYSFIVTRDRNIVANFGKTLSTIIVSSSNGDNSLVYIDTPDVLQKDILYGQTCSIHALEYGNGYVFNGWMDNDTIISYEPIYTFVVTDDKTLVANYIEERYLTFTANQDNSSVGFVIKTVGSVSSTPQVSLQYSIDNCVTWNTYTIGLGSENAQLINLNNGDNIKFRGINPNGVAIRESSSKRSYLNCVTNGSISASGDLNSIINNRGGDIILPNYCYYYMFSDCISLITVPELPSTHLANYCYSNIFNGCTSLVEAPELPAITLASSCYSYMFQGCTSLVEAPELHATILGDYCYRSMFQGCIELIQVPTRLPAITLANECYASMFYGCTKLIQSPELPATTLASFCYNSMFKGCTSLLEAPELPARYLAESCYSYMFQGCTSLVEAPELPATTLASSCYNSMFQGCTSLVEAPELPVTTLASFCYSSMFNGCTSLTQAPQLRATELVNSCYSNMFNGCTSLVGAPQLNATILAERCYQNMFKGCTSLTQAPQLPATILVNYCYSNMFEDCIRLTQAPQLPATTLATYCYYYMFNGCTSLTQAPQLNTITLAHYCYSGMFNGCTSLTQAPELPAITLTNDCYSNMFNGCTSLTQAPELPATTLANECYAGMFNGCTSLILAPQLNVTTLVYECYINMFKGCTSLTQAPELPATTLAYYCYFGMFNGCTSLTQAPELPATTLANSCYNSMFNGCTSLNYIKCLATDISATNCTASWVTGVSGSGTFIKDPNMNSWTTGNSGIPSEWTVQDNV